VPSLQGTRLISLLTPACENAILISALAGVIVAHVLGAPLRTSFQVTLVIPALGASTRTTASSFEPMGASISDLLSPPQAVINDSEIAHADRHNLIA
jgi:hypothetical protein